MIDGLVKKCIKLLKSMKPTVKTIVLLDHLGLAKTRHTIFEFLKRELKNRGSRRTTELTKEMETAGLSLDWKGELYKARAEWLEQVCPDHYYR